jgi:hypothetical protein
MYKDLLKEKELFNLNLPNTIVPVPTADDYILGYIRRYFIKKANDPSGFIYEVSSDVYGEYIENTFWVAETIKWRISGPIEETYKDNGEIEDRGVRSSNKGAIGRASAKLKNIGLYLPNLLQFHK